jgi:hypothetical protein
MAPSSHNPRMSGLKQFIKEALDAWNDERNRFRNKFPGVPDAWPPWPFVVNEDKIAERVSREVGTAQKVRTNFGYAPKTASVSLSGGKRQGRDLL